MSIKAKQVAGVVTLVVAIVATLSAYHFAEIARLNIQETLRRGQLLALAIYQRAREVTAPPGTDLREALRQDGGVRSLLESTLAYSSTVTSAAIVDTDGVIIAHGFPTMEGE
jgi:hypothetical protein